MIYGGIDGCKYGWILMKSNGEEIQFGGLFKSIDNLMAEHRDLDRILIDMPMGLSSKKMKRTVESAMKKELGVRHSTVFNALCREALRAKDYDEAKQINERIEGKKISIQTFFISKKIAEIDGFLKNNSSLKNKFIESHPEICFKYLNGEILLSKKSSQLGIEERLKILQGYYPNAINLYEEVVNNTKRKFVKRDDIVDSICLCVVNRLSGEKKMSFIEDSLIEDEMGIKMRIGYFKMKK
ncbi:MAG: DUF429 domain-containing protein [Chitinophagales bacterium]